MTKIGRRFLKLSYQLVLPTIIKKNIDLFHSLRNSGYPKLEKKPPGKSVLVLSPHPDDEVVGCGGVLAKHTASGDYAKILYMTDGRQGTHYRSMDPEKLVSLRKAEAERARNIIGIKDFRHLDYPDGKLRLNSETIETIREELATITPDVVYTPFFFETHPDHSTTANILAAALKSNDKNPLIYAYEVWTPLIPNCIVDISECIDIKRKALKQFESQRVNVDILEIFEGFSKYRAFIHLGKKSYVECFFSCTSREYLRFWKLLK